MRAGLTGTQNYEGWAYRHAELWGLGFQVCKPHLAFIWMLGIKLRVLILMGGTLATKPNSIISDLANTLHYLIRQLHRTRHACSRVFILAFITKSHFIFYVHMCGARKLQWMRRSEFILYFYYVDPRDWTQIIRFSGKHPYTWRHPANHRLIIY